MRVPTRARIQFLRRLRWSSDRGSEFKAETQEVFKEMNLKHKFVSSGNRIEKVNCDFQRTWYRLMRLGRGDL